MEASPKSVADAFASCARYDDADPGRRAQAALLAAAAYRDAGDTAGAAEVLTQAARRTPACVELGVAALRAGGDREAFQAAAVYDPERALVLASAAGLDARALAAPLAEHLSNDAAELLAAIQNAESSAGSARVDLTTFDRPSRHPLEAARSYARLRSAAGAWAKEELASLDRASAAPPPSKPSPLPPAPAVPIAVKEVGCVSFPVAVVLAIVGVGLLGPTVGFNPNDHIGTAWLIWIGSAIVGGFLLAPAFNGFKGNRMVEDRRQVERDHADQMTRWTAAAEAHGRDKARFGPVATCLTKVERISAKPWRDDPIRPRATLEARP